MPLTGKQRHFLRALAHSLSPVVQVGKHGVTKAVVAQLDVALETHELLKVKVSKECPEEMAQVGEALVKASRSALAQSIGRTLVLYRPRKQKPTIVLPKPKRSKGAKSGTNPAPLPSEESEELAVAQTEGRAPTSARDEDHDAALGEDDEDDDVFDEDEEDDDDDSLNDDEDGE